MNEEAGRVSITFDDGYDSHFFVLLPLLEKYGVKATFYVNSSLIGQPGYLTIDQLIELSEKGHEIASHGVSHRHFKDLSREEIKRELVDSKRSLETMIGKVILNFASPYGELPPYLKLHLEEYYQSNRTIAPGLNQINPAHPFALRACVLFQSTSLHQLEEWVERAINEKGWLILVYHGIEESEKRVSLSVDVLESHLKVICKREIATFTIQEALNR